jgi:NADPH2:quinone reductase
MRVAAVGVNFIETYQRAGIYAVDYPFVPGVEASGIIEGGRITTTEGNGSYAEYMLVDADKALPVPDGTSDEAAAALPAQGITAH